MAITYSDYTGDGSNTDFAFSFPYLEDTHVVVEVDGVDKTTTAGDFTLPTTSLARMAVAPALAADVRVKRVSDFATDLVDFTNGSVLTEGDLDRAYQHNRYLNEESAEGNDASMQIVGGGTDYNAANKKIVNLATPTASLDAANKNYVDDRIALGTSNLNAFDKSTHTGDNTETEFTLSFTPQSNTAEAYLVTIDGVVQTPTTAYSVNNATNKITFTSAPPTSASIVVVPISTTASVNDALVTVTGSTIARSLSKRLGDVVNVLDHIPSNLHPSIIDGTNTTDLTSYFNTAITEASGSNRRCVFVPSGIYKLSPLNALPAGTAIVGPVFNTGALNRLGAARLQFKSLSAGEKAIQVSEKNTLVNLSIEGEDSTRLGYGVYGGLTRAEGLGQYLDLINCRVEFFDISVQLSQILNCLTGCTIQRSNTGIVLDDIPNGTLIENCLIINLTASTGKGIVINSGDSVRIVNNTFESIPLHIEVNGGKITNIIGNRFEVANTGFIDVAGDGVTAANNHYLHVNIKDNFFEDYGASATTSSRYAVQIQRGYTTFEGNQVRKYIAATNLGIKYGIRWNMPTDGTFKGCYIGHNSIGAHVPIDHTTVDLVNRRLIQTPFSQSFDSIYNINGDTATPDFFNVASEEGGNGKSLFIKQVKLFVIDALSGGTPGSWDVSIDLGTHSAVDDPDEYLLNASLGNANTTEGSEVIVEQSAYQTNGNSIGSFTARAYRVRGDISGSPTAGRVGVTVELGIIRFRDLRE